MTNDGHSPHSSSKRPPGVADLPCDDMFVESYPHPAGVSMDCGLTYFDLLRGKQEAGQMAHYGPFNDHQEWELARWLMMSGASQTDIESFLKLEIVSFVENC
jgi:hypothetical protein